MVGSITSSTKLLYRYYWSLVADRLYAEVEILQISNSKEAKFFQIFMQSLIEQRVSNIAIVLIDEKLSECEQRRIKKLQQEWSI